MLKINRISSTVVCLIMLFMSSHLYAGENIASNNTVILGEQIFFDENLSYFKNQSCASCHDPVAGWTGPDEHFNQAGAVYEGSISGKFGNRKPPSAAYATLSPVFHMTWVNTTPLFMGGNFWDGRATGDKLGNPAADQAQGPFLNPAEQALSGPADVVNEVCNSDYSKLFKKVWGKDICKSGKVLLAYDKIALSIAAYENSAQVNAFSSKFDAFLKGKINLTKQEQQGSTLFNGKALCSACHSSAGPQPLFTDYTFDNLGIPRNPENPFYAENNTWIDQGLGAFLANPNSGYTAYAKENIGKHKVPTLRNVAKKPYPEFVKAYGHNGYFKSLKSIVNFYNTRDTKPRCANPFASEQEALALNCWPIPEVTDNLNISEMGNLGLTAMEEDALVAFLETLSDGFKQSCSSKNTNHSSGRSSESRNRC